MQTCECKSDDESGVKTWLQWLKVELVSFIGTVVLLAFGCAMGFAAGLSHSEPTKCYKKPRYLDYAAEEHRAAIVTLKRSV